MDKGVAIPYIVALVIGLMVIVFVVYWVYKMFSSPVDCGNCKARFIQWCNLCATANPGSEWVNPVAVMPLDLMECADKCNLHPKSQICKFDIKVDWCDIQSAVLCSNEKRVDTCITCQLKSLKDNCVAVGVK